MSRAFNYFIVGMAAGAVLMPHSWIGAACLGLLSAVLWLDSHRGDGGRG
jgi:hypothetical protein